MPYNNTPITPSKEITGTVALPLARVKKIIATDDDISNCSNNAAFVITVAAEMFLQHLVEQSYNIVKSERKPRRNIQYRDVANAVARVENLEFLTDVVPKTMTYKQHKQKKTQQTLDAPTNDDGDEADTNADTMPQATETAAQAVPRTGPDSSYFLARGQITADQIRPDGTIVGDIMPPGTHVADSPEQDKSIEIVEKQATNGASPHEVEAMDVDDSDGEGSARNSIDEPSDYGDLEKMEER